MVIAYTGVAELMSVTELNSLIVERQSTLSCCLTVVRQFVDGRTHAYTQHAARATYTISQWPYDTIRYDTIYVRSKADKMASLV